MKSTYIVCSFLAQFTLLVLAVFSPIYITPGWYVWTVISLILLALSGGSLNYQVSLWELDEE